MKTVTKFITETLDGTIYETTSTVDVMIVDGVKHRTHRMSKTILSSQHNVGGISNNTKNIIDSIKNNKGTPNE